MTIYKELSFENDIKTIEGIQFSILDSESIEKMSVCEITSTDTYSGSEPIIGGLFDSRMGVIENDKICKVCMQKNAFCPGHFGHIKLAKPVFHSQFFDTVRKIMKCVCYRCSSLLIDPANPEVKKIINKKINRQKKFDLIYKLSGKKKACDNPLHGCGAKMPHRIHKENIGRIIMEWSDNSYIGGEEKKVEFAAEDVLNILKRISDEDARILGFCPEITRPESLICTVFPVPPPAVRPSVRNDTGQRCEDDLTHKLCDIIKTNNTLKQKLANPATAKETIDTWVKLVQYHVSTFVDNQLPGVAPAKQRTGRPLRSITERLKSKEGRIRGNLMGKRVDFSARSVITPDPNISIDEVGVPIKIAMNLTFPETVNPFNRAKLASLIRNGPDKFPGAKFIKKVNSDYRTIKINERNVLDVMNIENGDIVERHLLDGDYVLFNRQPSLHKMSMMSHRVRVMHHDTFRLNVCCTPSYNADYDGDEMNMHVPQSKQTLNELKQLASVPTQIISPKDSSPIISIVQDITLGVFKITSKNTYLTQKQVMNLLANNTKFTGVMPSDAKSSQFELTSGKAILSTVIPPTISTEVQSGDIRAVIKDGVITDDSGPLNKDTFQKMSTGIVHSVYNDVGVDETTALFDNTQRLICDFLVYNGFSVGVSDLMLSPLTKNVIKKSLSDMQSECSKFMSQVQKNEFKNDKMMTNEQYVESKMGEFIDKCNKEIQNKVMKDANISSEDNRMLNMIDSKSKGNIVNVLQMMGAVGQVVVEGKRISYGFDDRTLPHYQKYDDSPEARGFVKHSFIDGLNPQEFFFHAMGGREGLIDTAVKTSETGYLQRKLVKAMEDAKVHYDMSVRNASGQIISFMYGDDGMDSTKLEKQFIPYLKSDLSNPYSIIDLKERYLVETYLKFKDYILPDVFKKSKPKDLTMIEFRRNMNKKLYDYFEQVVVDRRFVIERILAFENASNITYPIAFKRLIDSAATLHQLKEGVKVDLTPEYIFNKLDELGSLSVSRSNPCNRVLNILLRAFLNPKDLIMKRSFTKAAFDVLCSNIVAQFQKAVSNPSEMVGVVAAQSIGEPTTQLTLNTFHLSGVASASKAVRGVPRIKELLSISKNIKSPELRIYLTDEYKVSKKEANKAKTKIQTLKFSDFVNTMEVYYEAQPLEEDQEWMKQREENTLLDESYSNFESKWVLRIDLNKTELLVNDVTLETISSIMTATYNEKVSFCHSDMNSDNSSNSVILKVKIEPDECDDVISDLKALEQEIMNMVISGIQGINNVVVDLDKKRKILNPLNEKVEEVDVRAKQQNRSDDEITDQIDEDKVFMLITEGTNLRDVLGMYEYVDQERTVSNDIYEIYGLLGIEAARQALFDEIYAIFEGNGNVNQRHVSLLVDTMTCKGQLLSIDRHGINRSDIGPLAKCSFEETADILIKSGVFGDYDRVQGVAANVIVGQVPKAGTGDSAIILDHDMLSSGPLRTVNTTREDLVIRDKIATESSSCVDILSDDPFKIGDAWDSEGEEYEDDFESVEVNVT